MGLGHARITTGHQAKHKRPQARIRDVQAGEAAADTAFDSFVLKAGAFIGEVNSNANLRGLAASVAGDLRRLRHYGNPESWGSFAPHVELNTNDPKHGYEWFRRYLRSKTGKAPEALGLSGVVGLGITNSQ